MNSSPPRDNEINLLPPSKRDLSHKKRKGIFYTPDSATQLLAEWGIRNPEDTVLEPSFGGCGFIAAAYNQLRKLAASYPEKQLFGFDIDTDAFKFLQNLIGLDYDETHFKQKDFLTASPLDFQVEGVDVIIGNPPYVSWHNMLPSQRNSALATIEKGQSPNKKASLWTYFVAHSLRFLNDGGRMAWILPGSFVYSDYAEPIRKVIASRFSKTLAVLLEKRIFIEEGTEESTIVLLCDGYRQKSSQAIRFASVQGLSELEQVINTWSKNGIVGDEWTHQASRLLASKSSMQRFDTLLNSSASKLLGNLLKVRIGLVTGDNKFFVLNKSTVQSLELPRDTFRPIIARQAHFRGLQVSQEDLLRLESENVRCLLLNINQLNEESNTNTLKDYLNRYPVDEIRDNRTFAKRKPWYRILQENTPDAFFSSMNWYGPSLVLNPAQTTCTNTVYRVQFTGDLFTSSNIHRQIAVCLQSTYSQFSAELVGRVCGSGALKLEPSDVNRISILLPSSSENLDSVFLEIDSLLREGNHAEARKISDRFLIQHGLLNMSDVTALEEGLLYLRKLRQGARSPLIQ